MSSAVRQQLVLTTPLHAYPDYITERVQQFMHQAKCLLFYMKTGVVAGGRLSNNVRIAITLVALTAFTLLYLLTNDQLGNFPSLPRYGRQPGKYLVYGKHCQIPNSDPFDPSIQEYLAPTAPVICSALPLLTKIVQTPNLQHTLVIDNSAKDRYKVVMKHNIECCYSVVERKTQSLNHFNEDADKKFNTLSCQKIKERTVLKNTTEFIYVRCQSVPRRSRTGRIVYENMHAIVPKKISHIKNNETERLNVLIIGIDSVSRLSLRRTMPATMSYLNTNNWIEMDGYNKIADNTLPNLMAILSGHSLEELHKTCLKEAGSNSHMDECPTLWKDFKANGYLTAYAEDVPSLATFNYRMTGFVEQPTHYYMRPFMLAAHANLNIRNKDGLPVCVGPQSAADLIFDYTLDFASTLRDVPHFGLFWLNSFSHNDVNGPAALDLRLMHLLKQLDEVGTYNNTLVMVLSDHGIRFGKIRNSFQGFLEERLPFMFLRYPAHFLEKHPEAKLNLELNRNRLTSPYDVYATLSLLIGNSEPPKSCPTCLPLIEKISIDRACPDAGIDPHWCTCPNFARLSANHSIAKDISEFLHNRILNKTRDLIIKEKAAKNLCAQRTLDGIIRIHKASNMDFVIVIQTDPFGLFEATIRVEMNEWSGAKEYQVLGFISRLDSYFSTSKCVQSKMLQFYCHCL